MIHTRDRNKSKKPGSSKEKKNHRSSSRPQNHHKSFDWRNKWKDKKFPWALREVDKPGFLYQPMRYLENGFGYSLVLWRKPGKEIDDLGQVLTEKGQDVHWWELRSPQKWLIGEFPGISLQDAERWATDKVTQLKPPQSVAQHEQQER